MASNNEYKRYFIILQEDDKGFEMSPGKTPTGYVKIEVKNSKVRLNAFIQNVKLEDRLEYRLILVSPGKKLAVDIGKLIIDSSGRGELSYELESDNVLKSGMGIGDFAVAAVTSGTAVPLSGYTGRDKLEWKGRYDVVNRQKAQETARIDKKPPIEEIVPEIPAPVIPSIPVAPPAPVMPPKKAIPPEPIVPPAPVIPPKPKPEPVPVPIPVPVPEIPVELPPIEVVIPEPNETHIIENKVEIEIHVPKCPPMAPLEEPCEIEVEKEKEKKKEKDRPKCEDIKEYYCDDEDDHENEHHKHPVSPYYEGNMYRRLKKVLRKLRRCEPFERERGYEWFKVGDDIYDINEVAVPYMGYMMPMGYPFMSEGCSMMMDRKDYIIGVKYEDKDCDDRRLIRCLLYGVPAIFSKKNEQYYKSRGFVEFIPHKSKSYGYFIMCLDIGRGTLCGMD